MINNGQEVGRSWLQRSCVFAEISHPCNISNATLTFTLQIRMGQRCDSNQATISLYTIEELGEHIVRQIQRLNKGLDKSIAYFCNKL